MPRISSEILEEYSKLADKVGLTKLAEDSAEIKKYKDNVDSRMGSDDISTIEALYGIKPDTQEYEFNIMEQAHPNSVVISPSYDKMNGLVENNIERGNIMSNIAIKPPTGIHSNHKYAQSELVMELVRVANEMDARNKEELYKLADECLEGITKEAWEWSDISNWFERKMRNSKEIGEGAAGGAGIGAAVGGLITAWTGPGVLAGVPIGAATGALIGGVIAAFTKTEPEVKNVAENAQEVSRQLKDLYKKSPDGAEFFQKIDQVMEALIQSSHQYTNTLNTIKQHQIENDADTHIDETKVTDTANNFLANVKLFRKYHAEFKRRNDAGEFAQAKPSKEVSPVYWFMADDVEDVDQAMNSLEDAITALQNSVNTKVNNAVEQGDSTPKNHSEFAVAPKDDELEFISNMMSGKFPS